MDKENSHKSILKATGIFGFSQLLRILIAAVSSKFVAVFLGPVGIGVVGLLNNTLSIITSVTNFGINVTGVREIAAVHVAHDPVKLSQSMVLLQRIALFTGILGALIVIASSRWLSLWTFGTSDNYFWFVILSVNFLLSSLTMTRTALLHGTRNLKAIAVSSVVNSFCTALIIIPIYYFFRFEGIIPVLVATALIGLAVNVYFTRNFKANPMDLSLSDTIKRAKPIMALGFLLSINVIFGQVCTYVIKLYLNNNGSAPEILGFYEVSTVLLIAYVGMIFNAMGTDFYPKLASFHTDNHKVRELVNDQIEVGLLLITPAILFLYFIAPILIRLLYTKEFLSVLLILKAALFAIVIKAIIWPLAYIILAKGEKRLYFKQELLGDFMNITFTIGFYHLWGLNGIGIAMVLNYVIYGIYVLRVTRSRFDFRLRGNTIPIIVKCLLLGLAASLIVFFLSYPYAYFPLAALLLVSVYFSYVELDKRVDLQSYAVKIRNKWRR